MFDYLNNIIMIIDQNVNFIFTNNISVIIIKLLLIYYCIYINSLITPELIVLYDNIVFKILVLSLIYYSSFYDISIPALITIAFIISNYNINNIKLYDTLNISPPKKIIKNKFISLFFSIIIKIFYNINYMLLNKINCLVPLILFLILIFVFKSINQKGGAISKIVVEKNIDIATDKSIYIYQESNIYIKTIIIDGVRLEKDYLILIKNQTNLSENGIYQIINIDDKSNNINLKKLTLIILKIQYLL